MLKVKDVIEKIGKIKNTDIRFLNYKNIIIVGKNCSGKSFILKGSIFGDGYDYFIDSINRKITSAETESKETFDHLDIKEIIQERLDKRNFNKKDCFSNRNGTELIYSELKDKFSKYQELFKKIFDICLEKKEKDIKTNFSLDNIIQEGDMEKKNLTIDGVELDLLSDGIQAKLRILLEINYAIEKGCNTIFIDEFDIGFDTEKISENLKKIMTYYQDKNIRFILTTHSPYAIRDLENFDIIKIHSDYGDIDENICEIFDGNDFDNLEIIDKKIFYRNLKEMKIEDIILSTILKKKLAAGKLEKEEVLEIERLTNLSLKQQLIKSFILK